MGSEHKAVRAPLGADNAEDGAATTRGAAEGAAPASHCKARGYEGSYETLRATYP